MSKDTNELLGHADEADGIEEYDNPLPDWWVGLFWLTIIWSLAYGIHYHFVADRSFESALAAEMAAAEARWPAQTASAPVDLAGAVAITAEAVAAGEAVFNIQCFSCHNLDLSGGIGPSFLDTEWIHGGTAEDIVRIIVEGVPAKGMVPWGMILSPDDITNVAAYIIQRNAEATGTPVEEYVGSR